MEQKTCVHGGGFVALCMWPFWWSCLCLVHPQAFVVCCARKLDHFLTLNSEQSTVILCKLMQCKLYGPYRIETSFIFIHSSAKLGMVVRLWWHFCCKLTWQVHCQEQEKRSASVSWWTQQFMTCGARKSVNLRNTAQVGTECYRSYKNGPMLCPWWNLYWIMREAVEMQLC